MPINEVFLTAQIDTLLGTQFDTREGRVVPESDQSR